MKLRLSAIIGLICILMFCLAAILMYKTEIDLWRVTMIFCVVLGAGVFILSPQLDWWWFSLYPPKIDAVFKSKWLIFDPFYNTLNHKEAIEFEKRIELFIESKEWIAKQFETITEEVKYMISYTAAKVSFGQDQFLFSPYDRIVVYANAFLSPQMKSDFHHCESFEEDGVLLFTADSIVPIIARNQKSFDPLLYTFCSISARKSEKITIDQFCQITNFTESQIVHIIGDKKIIDEQALYLYLQWQHSYKKQ